MGRLLQVRLTGPASEFPFATAFVYLKLTIVGNFKLFNIFSIFFSFCMVPCTWEGGVSTCY